MLEVVWVRGGLMGGLEIIVIDVEFGNDIIIVLWFFWL